MAEDKDAAARTAGAAATYHEAARAQARRMLGLARELLDAAEAIIDETNPRPTDKGGKA
jgi:hypothetical protein